MVRKSKETPKQLTIGFFGDGEMSPKAIEKALNEHTEQYVDGVTVILPVTKDLFTDEMKAIAEWCGTWEEGVEFIAVHDEGAEKVRALKPFLNDAAKSYKIANVGNKIVALLKAVEDQDVEFGGIYVNTEEQVDEDADLEALAEKASDAGITVVCVNNDFDVVEFDDDGSGDDSGDDDDASGDADDAGDEPADADDDGGDEPYDEEALQAFDIKELKEIYSEDFKRELPEGRVYAKTLIKMILQAQEEDEAKKGKAEVLKGDVVVNVAGGSLDSDALAEKVVAQVAETVANAVSTANVEAFNEVLSSIESKLDELIEAVKTPVINVTNITETTADADNDDTPAPSTGRRRRRPSK